MSEVIRSFFALVELDKSVQEYIDEWLEIDRTISKLTKKENRENILQQVFMRFDADRNGVLDLQVRVYMRKIRPSA